MKTLNSQNNMLSRNEMKNISGGTLYEMLCPVCWIGTPIYHDWCLEWPCPSKVDPLEPIVDPCAGAIPGTCP